MSDASETITVVHNTEAHRFEIHLDGHRAVCEYMPARGMIVFTHTEVPPALEGRGLANRLAQAGLEYARTEGLQVLPLCPFVAAYLRRHPEYQDLVVDHRKKKA